MNRHVFPRVLVALVLAVLMVAAPMVAVGRADDGDSTRPPPKPTEATPADDPARSPGAPAVVGDHGAAAAEAAPVPPSIGDAFPTSLPVRALPRPGARPAPDASGERAAGGHAEGAGAGPGAAGPGSDGSDAAATTAEQPVAAEVTLAELVGAPPRPVVVLFWSSRCVVCKRYGEVLQRLARTLGERAALVLVATGADETPESVRAALEAAGLRLPVYLDTEKRAAAALGVRVTPTAFLVDADGVLRYRGPIDDDRRARSRDARALLAPAVEAVVAGKALESGDVRPFGCALR